MADPLSIAAGIVAILQATGKTAQGLEMAWQLRHRGQDFFDLRNQVASFSPNAPAGTNFMIS